MPHPQHLEVAITSMRTELDRVESEKAALERRADELRAAIRSLERQTTGDEVVERRPRGKNLADVLALYQQHPGKSFTPTEVAKRLGLSVSSAQAALSKSGQFERADDGTWRAMKEEQK